MITQRKALARMEQQTRIAQRRLEDGYNAMLLKLWKGTLADIRATVLDTYRQDFGRGTWDLVGAQTRGTLSRINDRSAERLLLFKAEATLLIERSLAHIHNQERLRALWMIDQTTPQSFLPKAPPRSVREADNPRDAKATWSVALNAWVDNYQSQLANNLRMEALHEGDAHDAADEPEATRVAGYDPAYKFSSMFAGESIREEADARRDIFDGNDDVVEEEIWVTMEDGIVCEICAGYDQKPLSEVEDDIPAHYNCRCYTRFVPKAWADMMRSGNSDERDAAQAMDDAGLVKDSMAIRSPKTGDIIARAVISFEDWQAERGQNIAGVAGML